MAIERNAPFKAKIYAYDITDGDERPLICDEYGHLIVGLIGTPTRSANGTTEELITNQPAILIGVIGNAGNAGALSIRDDNAISQGSTHIFHLDLGDVGGTGLSNSDPHHNINAIFTKGITVQGDDANTDVTILWKPLSQLTYRP